MRHDEAQLISIMQSLRERAKELNCLYRVDDLLSSGSDLPMEEVLQGIIDALPHGWQYSDICKARIVLNGTFIEPPNFQEYPWAQSANIIVEGESVGSVEVFYTKQMPHADEGPFL